MKRIIVKIGTKILSNSDGTVNERLLENLVNQIVELRKKGFQVIVITSGAVGSGKSILSLTNEKPAVVQKQIFAAVGQVKLMTTYSKLFEKHNYYCAQVLTTKEDFRDEEHYINMQNCFEGLLLDNVIPVVNENDVVATTELLFTDNDELAGLVAKQLKADSLIIITSTDGILDATGTTIPQVTPEMTTTVLNYITPDTSTGGRGGMTSKFNVANELSKEGIVVHIVDGKKENVLLSVINEEKTGTKFIPSL